MMNYEKALAEYAAIVDGIATEYDNTVTIETIRKDHPELNFMDDEEITELLTRAQTKRNDKKEDETMKELHKCPEWNKYIKGRALVWYRRECSAHALASRIDGEQVTQAEYEKAFALLDKIQRYALASANQWTRDNDGQHYNERQSEKAEQRLNKRRNALQAELSRYNVKMVNYGLYPSIVENGTCRDLCALHYFD